MHKRYGFQIANIAGLPVRIDPSWFLILALVTWTLARGYFPQAVVDLTPLWYWTLALVAALLLFASVVLHELGHAALAQREGQPVGSITLFLFGGVAELSAEPQSPGAELRITLGGWLVSALLAVICYVLYRMISPTTPLAVAAKVLLQYLALINAVLFVFNGLPGFPLDGGRLLRALLWYGTGDVRKATAIASRVSGFLAILLIAFGVLIILAGDFIGGVWLMLIGLFLRHGARRSYQQLLVRRALTGVPVSELMNSNLVDIAGDTKVDTVLNSYFLRYQQHGFAVRNAAGELLGLISLPDVKAVAAQKWPVLTAAELVEQYTPGLVSVAPDTDAAAALTTIEQTGQRQLAVIAEQQLLGVVTRREITHFLAIKTDLLTDAAWG